MSNLPKDRNTKTKYVICPDISCTGFMEDRLRCQNSKITQDLFPNEDIQLCPHLDTAKKVVFCHWGHPIEDRVNSSNWQRADCHVENCHSMSFARMSKTTVRIDLNEYEEFLKLPFNNR